MRLRECWAAIRKVKSVARTRRSYSRARPPQHKKRAGRLAGSFAAEQLFPEKLRVETQLDLIGEELRLISTGSLYCLPVEVCDFERNPGLTLLERVDVGEGDASACAMLPGFGLQIKCRSVEGNVRESRYCSRDREGAGVLILGLVPIDVLARDREEIVEHDPWGGLELECGA